MVGDRHQRGDPERQAGHREGAGQAPGGPARRGVERVQPGVAGRVLRAARHPGVLPRAGGLGQQAGGEPGRRCTELRARARGSHGGALQGGADPPPGASGDQRGRQLRPLAAGRCDLEWPLGCGAGAHQEQRRPLLFLPREAGESHKVGDLRVVHYARIRSLPRQGLRERQPGARGGGGPGPAGGPKLVGLPPQGRLCQLHPEPRGCPPAHPQRHLPAVPDPLLGAEGQEEVPGAAERGLREH
mmetsp:Transcript_140413/g.391473  ORF Transcript_140413/g.391473 Transcript_140413/m.391473 type:complete len:243 (-) Transcript_140413:864-1592(-)